MVIIENNIKKIRDKDIDIDFNMETGKTEIWNPEDKNTNPLFSPFPIIADMEITTICDGINNVPCPFCYKSNTKNGKYMDFITAKHIIDILPDEINQIAFGVDSKCESNPYWYPIFSYCRSKNIIPNVTVADISESTAEKLSSVCGAVAVSRYDNKDVCYNSIDKLHKSGMKYINIHQLLSEETYNNAIETLLDLTMDERIKDKVYAIVFLSLKQKGRGKNFTILSKEKFKNIVRLCVNNNINFGFDSCSGRKYLDLLELEEFKDLQKSKECVTGCESSCFSCYINVNGMMYPCSFTEGITDGINVNMIENKEDFIEKCWNSETFKKFRRNVILNKNRCSVFTV